MKRGKKMNGENKGGLYPISDGFRLKISNKISLPIFYPKNTIFEEEKRGEGHEIAFYNSLSIIKP